MTSFIKRIERDDIKELTAHDRYQERQRIAEEQHIKRVADIAPPKREWVGLTNADKHEAFEQIQEASEGFWEFADYLEAKLKEKNT